MKKAIILLAGATMCYPLNSTAQTWSGSSTAAGDTYRYGRVGIDRTSSSPTVFTPLNSLHVKTNVMNDGIRIEQTGGTGATLELSNSGTGGRNYALYSTGPTNLEGAGNFGVYDYSGGGWKMYMEAATANVGFGTGSNALSARLQARTNINSVSGVFIAGMGEANLGVDGVPIGLRGIVTNNIGPTQNFSRGVWGTAQTPNISGNFSSYNYGVHGVATGGHFNVGGYFEATASGTARTAIGVYASYSVSSGASGWAAYFNGNTFCSGSYTTSDRQLKTDIVTFTNAVDKLKLLRPTTYVYKTNEFSALHLPEGKQIGLIAQELETVFPELVRDVPGFNELDENGKVVGTLPSLKSVNYDGLIPVLIAAIQEQQQQLDEQSAIIADLKERLDANTFSPESIADQIRLYQNTPNPFNRETVIRYAIPETVGSAYIAVYDLNGKQLLTVPLTEKGENTVTIASNSLSPGLFVYAIVADNQLITSKRMVITD